MLSTTQSFCATRHLYSIVVDPDSLSIVGSNVVHHNVGPSGSGWSGRILAEMSVS